VGQQEVLLESGQGPIPRDKCLLSRNKFPFFVCSVPTGQHSVRSGTCAVVLRS